MRHHRCALIASIGRETYGVADIHEFQFLQIAERDRFALLIGQKVQFVAQEALVQKFFG